MRLLNNLILISPIDGKLKFENIKLIEDKISNKIILTRNAKIKIETDGDRKIFN